MSNGKHVFNVRYQMDDEEFAMFQEFRKLEAFEGERPTVRSLLYRAMQEGIEDLKMRHADGDYLVDMYGEGWSEKS